jgi:Zn-dependent membrane protease YugP
MHLLWIDYVMIVLPGFLVTIWAHIRIARAFTAGRKIASASESSGAETAALIMEAGNVGDVAIEPVSGELGNYYDAAHRTLRLSPEIFEGRSSTAVGVAAHEAGHAIQHAQGYPGLIVRNAVVPWAVLGCQICWILLAAGFWLGMMRLIVVAIGLFWLHLLVELANLPVELDASRRAREILGTEGLADDEWIARVANAVAWTHVAIVLWPPSGPRSIVGRRSKQGSRTIKAGDDRA